MASKGAAEAMIGISSMSTTMMPFLYQTRTLSALPWIRTNLTLRPRYASSIEYPSLARRVYKTPLKEPRERGPESGPYRSPQRGPKNVNRSQDPDWGIAFEGEEKPRRSTYSGRDGSATKSSSRRNLNEFGENDDGMWNSGTFEEEEGFDLFEDEKNSEPEVPKSTITDRERRAFQNIFSDMFAEKPALVNDSNDRSRTREQAREHARAKLSAIMADAMVQKARNPKEREAIVNQYPPALRESITEAMGLKIQTIAAKEEAEKRKAEGEKWFQEESGDVDAEEGSEKVTENAEVEHDHLEALREPERTRVETLMKEAKTDFELWKVMEKEVFTLISRLGLDKTTTSTPTDPKKKKSKKVEKDPEPAFKDEDEGAARFKQMVAETTNGTEAAVLNTYGPLFPSYLLLAIRLFDRSFAKPSPLALAVLPKIKHFGNISRVLGGSTQFYNEVLRILLHRYENIEGMIETLTEMEKWAVEFDQETLDILLEAMTLVSRVRAGSKGPAIKYLWGSMPQFTGRGLKQWKNKIALSLVQPVHLG